MSTRILCPSCDGGRSKERSCLVSTKGGVTFYHCFRASCPKPNGVYSGVYLPPQATHKLALPDIKQLPEARMKWLADKFDLDDTDLSRLRPLWVEKDSRYWFPINGPTGEPLGGVARSYTRTPKSLTFSDDWSLGCWYKGEPTDDTVWLVEDQLSAVKMARHAGLTVALLGTHLGGAGRVVLGTLNKRILVALDADAWHISVRLSLALQDLGIDASPVHIGDVGDIKGMTRHDVQETYKKGC